MPRKRGKKNKRKVEDKAIAEWDVDDDDNKEKQQENNEFWDAFTEENQPQNQNNPTTVQKLQETVKQLRDENNALRQRVNATKNKAKQDAANGTNNR